MTTIGVDIGGTKMLLLAHDAKGQPVRERRVGTGPAATPEYLSRQIHEFARTLPGPPQAVGIAVPGLVDPAAGRVEISDVLPELAGWQPAELLGTGIPHVLVNDIRAALVHTSRDLPADATAATLVAGTAIGMGWMANGKVVHGVRGWAGEIGSTPVPTPRGVRRLDELAGGAAVVAATGLTPAAIHAALAATDPAVTAAVRAAGASFGLAIATVVNLLNPLAITLAGGTLTYPGYLDSALRTAEQTALPQLWQSCTIRRADDAPRIVALGAIHLAGQAIT
ncbi:ROK family protein [Planosporangium sp. 12N6]|uniref:ROK family protein n=1 Tax=Planosporangium spinosum TaxID=3402278 RepID=UPI003CF4C959